MLIVQRRTFIVFLYDWTDSSTYQAQSYLLPYFFLKQTSAKSLVRKL